MQFFHHLEKIYLNSFEQFSIDIDASRKQMLQVDYNLINNIPENIDLESNNNLPQGRFYTILEKVKFECFFHYKQGKPLYVVLNGARKFDVGHTVIFSRWSYYKFMNGSMLNIADPMLDLYPNLRLGWYYGSKEINFRKLIAELVSKIAEIYSIRNSDIIFVGSSGGGAAIIECASYIKGAKAVAINPQIVLSEYGYANEFTKITGNDLQKDEKWHRHNAIFHLQNNLDTTFILIVNLRSYADIMQLQNICKAKGIRVKYGLNIYDNLIIWIYDGDAGTYTPPHDVQEYYCIWFFIEQLVENTEYKEYLEKNESLYRLVNEFWHEHYSTERKWKNRICCVEKVLDAIGRKSITAIFGIGRKAIYLAKGFLDISQNNYFHIRYALDNDMKKKGSVFQGIPVNHPSDIDNWDEIYVIITSDLYDKEIQTQLEQLGLKYGKDFVSYKDLWN